MDDFKVVMIAAITADGFIGRNAEHLADWTSPEDKKLFVEVTKACGAMVMGSKTFATIGRALPGRKTFVYTSKPDAIQVEGVEATSLPPKELVTRLRTEGANGLAVCGGASIYEQFMSAGVVDELYLTVEPLLFGKGVGLFSSQLEQQLTLVSCDKLNQNSVLLKYAVQKS